MSPGTPLRFPPVLEGYLHGAIDVAFVSPGTAADVGHGIGSAVVDLIFSIAKREVTFFNGTAAIRRL
jgi:hypothetical protein